MNATRFDHLTRTLLQTPSRRTLLSGLAALGLLALSVIGAAGARKKRTKRKKPPAFNQFGCLNVG